MFPKQFAKKSNRPRRDNLSQKAKSFADDSSHVAAEYYSKANTWVQQNYGKTLGLVGFLGAIGLIGYFIGRNSSSHSEFEADIRRQ